MIPLFKPFIPEPEDWLPFYRDSIKSGMLTNFGPNHFEVEQKLRELFVRPFLPVANGTIALEVALLGLPESVKQVAIPDFTFAATANAVIRSGKTPVIFACEAKTLQMPRQLLWENRTKFEAILAVAPFGFDQDFDLMNETADESHRLLIWDLAGAWPMFDPRRVCCYSLHAAKSLPVGEGGLIRFPIESKYHKARSLVAFDFDENKSARSPWGLNGKLDEVHCAILLAQLKRHSEILHRIDRRRALIRAYQEALGDLCIPRRVLPSDYPSLCVLNVPGSSSIVSQGVLEEITFRKYYYPWLSKQKGFSGFEIIGESDPELDNYVAFPSDVSDVEFEKVVACVKRASRKN